MPERGACSQTGTEGEPARFEASTLRHREAEIAGHRGIDSRPQSTAKASGLAPLGLSGQEAAHRARFQARNPGSKHSHELCNLDRALQPCPTFMPRPNVRGEAGPAVLRLAREAHHLAPAPRGQGAMPLGLASTEGLGLTFLGSFCRLCRSRRRNLCKTLNDFRYLFDLRDACTCFRPRHRRRRRSFSQGRDYCQQGLGVG